ncbi:MAG: penicillin-insensitive murein endopeptidase, partial [Bradymonadaceae bacterium]
PGRDGKSVSWGRASDGKLYNGVPLKSWHGLDTRSVSHAYGTERVVQMLMAAAADVQARWPDSPDLVVGHLSYKNGGPMSPHKSHESGRDADLS